MKKVKLTLKKEVISDLELTNVTGGAYVQTDKCVGKPPATETGKNCGEPPATRWSICHDNCGHTPNTGSGLI